MFIGPSGHPVTKTMASNVAADDVLTNCTDTIEDSIKIKIECFEDSVKFEDLGIKCRGCLSEDPEMHYLFTVVDQTLSLADILEHTTSYIAREDDGFPPYLCTKCTKCLVDFFNFKQQYGKIDLYIRTVLSKNKVLPLEDDYVKDRCSEVLGDIDQTDCDSTNKKNVPFCDSCNELFVSEGVLDTHMAKIHGQNPFEKYALFRNACEENKKTKSEIQKKLKCIKADREEMKMLGMPGRLCRFCRTKFPEDEFRVHWDSHKKHVCEHCGHKCIKKSDLDIHIQSVHGHERNYKCHICTKSFKTKQLLSRHLIVHTNPRSFICQHCGNRFNDRTTLNTHIQLKHIKSRDFICSICGLAFPLKSTLEKHVLRHNKNRPPNYFCSICNAAFKDKSSLKRHQLIKHNEDYEKPQCKLCQKAYCSKTRLRYHMDRHHNPLQSMREDEKPQCRFCGKTYSSQTTLKYHIQRFHGKYTKKKRDTEDSFADEMYLINKNDDINGSSDNVVQEEFSHMQIDSSDYVYPIEIGQYTIRSGESIKTEESDSDYC